MIFELSECQPRSSVRRRMLFAVATGVVLAGGMTGCTGTTLNDPKPSGPASPDPVISQLENVARRLASTALAPAPVAPLTSGSGQANEKGAMTLTGFRGHAPLKASVACHGQGDLTLHVATTLMMLSCARDQTRVIDLPPEVSTANALTVVIDDPSPQLAAWGAAVFGDLSPSR
ncbi:hypothetical protein [Amycolatopsis sp. NPDC004169]|uniref:hypothetical protein n=1 Tax=Amycolatopsis sp. NPDC004169 TaxID=3154453 RepID=UPI0033B5F3AE